MAQTWKPDDYRLELPAAPGPAVADRAFALVWRVDFTAPGFCLLEAGAGVDSHTLRSWMVEVKERFSEMAVRCGQGPFGFRSLGRFDQQETTKFHLDGAPERSVLLLGYEPSRVRSRLTLADYSRAAFDLGLTPQEFLREHNPMYRRGEVALARHVTELPPPAEGRGRLLLINNSTLPFTEARTNPLGVMHRAEILNPTPAERRVVNSAMLVVGADEVGREQQEEFVRTEKISQRVY
jgi:hypothetical protein